jgi:hypothetical protein
MVVVKRAEAQIFGAAADRLERNRFADETDKVGPLPDEFFKVGLLEARHQATATNFARR